MVWKLNSIKSESGEVPGNESQIGFRGTRFRISKAGKLYVVGYKISEPCFANATWVGIFVQSVRDVLGNNKWSGSIRIRANGDTYASGEVFTYIGNIDLSSGEEFDGFYFGGNGKPPNFGNNQLYFYGGPHNHLQVGERWTIPQDTWAKRQGHLGNVGKKVGERGDWVWSSSDHKEFIDRMRTILHLNADFIRFYITCYGYVVCPIPRRFWNTYEIDENEQLLILNKMAPEAAQSMRIRMSNQKIAEDTGKHYYIVVGHIDDLMNGSIPEPDKDDLRTAGINEDKRK